MVLDTSAIFALIANEPEVSRFQGVILAADTLAMSAVTALETAIVPHGRFGVEAGHTFDAWLSASGVVVVPFDNRTGGMAPATLQAARNVRCLEE